MPYLTTLLTDEAVEKAMDQGKALGVVSCAFCSKKIVVPADRENQDCFCSERCFHSRYGFACSNAFLVAVFLLFALAGQVFASGPVYNTAPDPDPMPAVAAGSFLLIAPTAVAGPGLDVGHGWELEGFSYAATDIFGRVFPPKLWPAAPILVGILDAGYRLSELGAGQDDLVKRKLVCDLAGILGRVSVQIFEF